MAEAEAVGGMTIAAIRASRVNRAGSFSNIPLPASLLDVPAGCKWTIIGDTYAERTIYIYQAC